MTPEPLRLSHVLHCSAAHAFATWVEHFDTWWPRAHSVSGAPQRVVLEPRLGGRIYEVDPEGREIEWGQITRFEPAHALGYRWHIRRTADEATDVLIRFVATAENTCTLEITHSGWERLGAEGPSWREQNTRGWAGVLPELGRAAEHG